MLAAGRGCIVCFLNQSFAGREELEGVFVGVTIVNTLLDQTFEDWVEVFKLAIVEGV